MRDRPVDLAKVVILWILLFIGTYMPFIIDTVGEQKYWLNLLLITFFIPNIIHAIARGQAPLDLMAVDFNFFFTATVVATFFTWLTTFWKGDLKDKMRNFGRDPKSTGIILSILGSYFALGSLVAYFATGQVMYVHALRRNV